MPSLSQKNKAVNNDNTDERDPGQDCANDWGLDEVDWKEGYKAVEEESFAQVVEAFCFVVFAFDETEDLEHVVSHEDVEEGDGDHDFLWVEFADLAAVID